MPPTGPKLSDDTLEGLTERIEMRQPLAAHASYQKIIESGCYAALSWFLSVEPACRSSLH